MFYIWFMENRKIYKGVRLSQDVVNEIQRKETELRDVHGLRRTTFTRALESLVREYAVLKIEQRIKQKAG